MLSAMDPMRIFPVVAIVSIPTVMYGGYALLGFLTRGEGLTDFKQTFFRAGHAHAGVLLVLALVYFEYLARTRFSEAVRWVSASRSSSASSRSRGGSFCTWRWGPRGAPRSGRALRSWGR